MSEQPANLRVGAPVATQAPLYGLLTDLIGNWVGNGWNLISKPGFDVPPDGVSFVLQVNQTKETLTFGPIAGSIPDRGSVQPDLIIYALTYAQQVSDAATNGLLHVERGMWMNLNAGDPPPQGIVRLATIPHGDSVLAQGMATSISGPPSIPKVDPTPIVVATGEHTPPGYFPPDPPLFPQVDPAPIPPEFDMNNPNTALTDVIDGQTILNTTVLRVSTNAADPSFGGGILNIPFVTKNADAILLDATFWIETVAGPTGMPFLQLQYTQNVMLRFPDKLGQMIDWPHISVGTLVKN